MQYCRALGRLLYSGAQVFGNSFPSSPSQALPVVTLLGQVIVQGGKKQS